MNFIELFAGIGGFSLGFERAGLECVGHVEIDPYAQKILKMRWPDVPLYPDVTRINGDEFGRVDVIAAGFPCQDLSLAGKQGGIHGKRSGLYDEIIRIAWVLGNRQGKKPIISLENVANLLARIDWFEYVLGRLAEIGYDAEWEIIRASDLGAPHRRARVWIVAYPNGESESTQPVNAEKGARELAGELANADQIRWNSGSPERQGIHRGEQTRHETDSSSTESEILADPKSTERQGSQHSRGRGNGFADKRPDVADPESVRMEGSGSTEFQESQIQAGQGLSGRNGTGSGASHWEIEPDVGRVAHGVPSRVDRLKCLGNSLVPQIAEYIGHQIIELNTNINQGMHHD